MATFDWKMFAMKRILCVGMGGGCDAIFAYGLAQHLLELPGDERPIEVVYGNCTSRRSLEDLEPISDHVWRFRAPVRALKAGETGYGALLVEQSLPRGSRGCPLLLFIEKAAPEDTPTTLLARNREKLLHQLAALAFDLVIGIDAGGDSLTGGIDWTTHPSLGRDRQVLALFSALSDAHGVPFYHMVVAPGCDGESSRDQLQAALFDSHHDRHILGSFAASVLLPHTQALSTPLSRSRTPNIVEDVCTGALSPDEDDLITVPRHGQPKIPRSFLNQVYVLTWSNFQLPL